MKILDRKAYAPRAWNLITTCGTNGSGCGSKLHLEQKDLFRQMEKMENNIAAFSVRFFCPVCGNTTPLMPKSVEGVNINTLPEKTAFLTDMKLIALKELILIQDNPFESFDDLVTAYQLDEEHEAKLHKMLWP